jgi:chromosome segregation ATPase
MSELENGNAEQFSGRTGRPTEYDDELVVAAGEKLLEAGRRVTGYALRREVGGGDPNRLSRIWKAHLQQQEVIETEPVQELPVEVEELLKQVTTGLVEQMNAMAVRLNSMAIQTAERRVADVMASARETQEQAEAELADAAATVEDLEKQLDTLQDVRAVQDKKLEVAAEAADRDWNRISQLERELAVTTEKLEQEGGKRVAAENELKELNARNKALENDKNDLRNQRDALKSSVDEQKVENSSLKSANENLVNTRSELKTQLATLAEREEAALRRIEQAEKEKKTAVDESAELGRRAIASETEAKALQKQLDNLMSRVSVGGDRAKASSKRPAHKQDGVTKE